VKHAVCYNTGLGELHDWNFDTGAIQQRFRRADRQEERLALKCHQFDELIATSSGGGSVSIF